MGVVRFDHIAKECRETYKGSFENVPIVGLEHIEPYDMLLKKFDVNVETTFTKSFKQGQILFGRRRAYQHKACVATFDGVCSGDITVIEPIEGAVNRELLPFIVQNDDFFEHAIKGSNGALSPRVKWQHMASFDVNLPEPDKQRELAEILWTAYEVKQSYLKMIDAIDELVRARFVEVFGNPNENPKHFPTKLVSEGFNLQMGKTPARDNPRYWSRNGRGNKWISIADMSGYEFYTTDTEEYISDEAISESGIKLIPGNTVIMSFKLTIGRVAVTAEPIYSNEAIISFIPRSNDYETRFFYCLVKYYDWLENAALAVKGKTLNKDSIGKNKLIIPPMSLQKEFSAFSIQADKTKYELRKSIDAIDKVIKSLINENL